MCPSTESPASEQSGDPLWGVLVGTYLGLLVAPPAVFGAVGLGMDGAGVLYGVSVVVFAGAVGLGWLATARWDGAAIRLGSTRARWLPAAIPVAYALGGFASRSATGTAGVLAFFGGLGAMVVGLVLGVMARTRHTGSVLDSDDIACEFRAGWPAPLRKRLALAVGAFTLVTGACLVVGLLADWFALQLAGQLLLPLGVVSYSSTEERDYTVSPAGLEQRLPVARRLTTWDAFRGYSRTDDALVLHRPRRVDVRFALADLDDPEAVEAALGQYLRAA
ncbi:hypothetical protein [Haloarcula laminariae]|uniref:hypothetical protein n=1 Tax=Haloarcula laminariae TaxID=2961577 RepID=UPI00240739AE|nr:hypothetical protein [Halomicroarcula sp. FL173]